MHWTGSVVVTFTLGAGRIKTVSVSLRNFSLSLVPGSGCTVWNVPTVLVSVSLLSLCMPRWNSEDVYVVSSNLHSMATKQQRKALLSFGMNGFVTSGKSFPHTPILNSSILDILTGSWLYWSLPLPRNKKKKSQHNKAYLRVDRLICYWFHHMMLLCYTVYLTLWESLCVHMYASVRWLA